ncbi:MAG: AGE family epimerase/isomerase [Ancalomicrobiaceae bacterium]|nr:AGE family epimerase/isomerase [Ancalomicrobiaceae bacterium]
MTAYSIGPNSPKWVTLTSHRAWLLARAEDILTVFERNARNPKGGFHDLDDTGKAMTGEAGALRALHATTRIVHCFAIAHLMGHPGAAGVIDHGMDYLWNGHRDRDHGGYLWSLNDDGPVDATKQAYGQAFVLLAASSAKIAGHPDADRMIADITEVLNTRYWEESHGAVAEEFTRDWKPFDTYRGQNSNMHLTEALMAAFEATGDGEYLKKAERIAELIISGHARAAGWHLPEHFTEDWQVNRDYSGSPMFRPYGTTPGHSLEWARLLLQLWELGQRRLAWLPEASKALFARAITDGWDHQTGGFYYTLEWDGAPRIRHRYWWPCCEGIGAAAFLGQIDGAPLYEEWYRRIWNFVADHFIDPNYGGWFPQLDENLQPNTDPFFGKPDIYHSLQACLIPMLPTSGSIASGLVKTGIRL